MASEDPPARANPARGLALIATVLIVGIFVLRQGFDTSDELAAGPVGDVGEEAAEDEDGGETGEADDSDDEATPEEAPPEEPPEPRAPSEVTVRVANTTSVGGAAGGWSDSIEQNSYLIAEATDAADPERDRAATAIVYAEGFEPEARVLAEAIGDPEQIELRQYAAEELLSQSGEAMMTEDVNLLVLLGEDLANQAGG
jgi:hypothetical protein